MSRSILCPPASTTATFAPSCVNVWAAMPPPAPDPTITTSKSSAMLYVPLAPLLHHMGHIAHCHAQDGQCRIGHARCAMQRAVGNEQIMHIVRLSPAIRHEPFGIVA